MKKFISLMLSLAMICSLLVALPMTVSAVATTPIEQGTVPPEFTNVAMLLGEDITQRNFTWFSADAGEGKIIYEKVDEMVNGDFSENASVAVATRDTRYGEQSHKAGYYQNAAVMTGLEPGETYVYQLSNGATKSEMYTIAIGDDDSSFSFAYGGDAQVGGMDNGTYEDEVEAWGRTLKQITTADEFDGIEFFMSGGDQIESASTSTETELQYDIYLNHDEFKSLPQAVILGNHDDKTKGTHSHHFDLPNLDPDYGATYHWQETDKFNSANYYFVYNSMLVIGLNLNGFDNNNVGSAAKEAADRALAEEHGEFIQKVLEETKDNKDILWRVVLTHQSPYGSSYHGNYKYNKDANGNPVLNAEGYPVYPRAEQYYYSNIRKYLLPYLYEADIDLVLSGHDHSYTRTHIIKPVYDRETGTFTDSSEITPYADNSYTFADGTTTPTFNQAWTDANGVVWPNHQVSSKPVKVTNPDGLMWVTGASSSGSQVNNAEYHNPYAAVIGRAETRHIARFDVTENSLSMKVYNLGNNKTENITLFDEFTIERTADVKVGGVSVDETATVAVGKAKTLAPKFSPAEPTNTNVTWKSDNEAVAKVENGVVTGVSAGTANITVTTEDGGYTATCAVTVVEDVPVTAISLPATMDMMIGETKTIAAKVAPDNAITKALVWSSSDENIATVSANGSVKAIKHGKITITATATDGSGVSASCVVNIGYIASERVLSETNLTLDVMDKAKLTVTQTPANASYKNLVWQSSNPDIVEVDQNGNLKAWAQGTATISVVNEEGSVDCQVTVLGKTTFLQDYEDENYTILSSGTGVDEKYWNRVQEEDGNWVMEVKGENYSETSKVGSVYTNQITTENVTDEKVWTPSMKGGYVLDMDVKRMTEEGQQALNIRTYDENATKIAYMVKLTAMEVGEWYDVKILLKTDGIEAYYKKWSDDAWTKDIYWNGTVWKSGQTISGKSLDNFMAICPYRIDTNLTLEEAQKTQIRFDNIKISAPVATTGFALEETSGSLDVNETKQLKPIFTPSNVTDDHVVYTSSNPEIATVDKYGVVKARMTGDAVITAKAVESGLTEEYAVNVYSSIKVEQVIVPETLDMMMGETKQITATVLPETAAGGVVWSSSNEELATVDENGNITAIKHGEVDIIATAVDGSGKNGVCKVSIGYISSNRTLNYTNLDLDLFKTAQLVLTFDNENASYKEITWSSSNPGVASVDKNGLVTANGNGTAVISATTGEGSVECNVTVNGGVTYFNDFSDETITHFISGNNWARIQEEDGNWVLDMNAANVTGDANGNVSRHLNGGDSGVENVLIPGSAGGFVLDFDVKRLSAEGHKTINLRIGTNENANHWWRINISKFDLNEWYDVKLYVKDGESTTYYWKKATDSTWNSTTVWWGTSPYFINGSVLSSTIKKNSLVFYPYVAANSDDITLATAQKTHFRLDNIKVTSPVSATGFDIAEDNINLAAGESAVLTNVFTPSNATDTHVTYVSSDVNVATVDKYGKVTAIANGNAVITAIAADGGFVATVNVTVGAVIPELIVVKETTASGLKFTVTSNVVLDAAKVYVAAYDSSDRMVGAGSGEYVAEGTEIPMNVSNAAYFKVFAWDASAKAVIETKTVE